MSNVVPLFANKVADRVVDRVVPPPLAPTTMPEFRQGLGLQVDRDRTTNNLGWATALVGGVGVFFLVRHWRLTSRRQTPRVASRK